MSPPHENNSNNKDLHTSLLLEIQKQVAGLSAQTSDVRERVIRLETHGYGERLLRLEQESDDRHDSLRAAHEALQAKVIVLETQGKFFTTGIAAAVSAVTAFVIKYFGSGGHAG